jgi:undecaprenyl phosphate-alpha-L-ara4N flippase subunit ArnE
MTATAYGVLLAVLGSAVEGLAQVFLKKSALSVARAPVWIALAILAFILHAAVYTKVLLLLDVSIAFPLGNLSFISVTLLSKWLLREKVKAIRWAGVCFILFGVSLVVAQA